MSCVSWSDNPFMHSCMVYFLLLSTKILSNKVVELLAILVGKYMVPVRYRWRVGYLVVYF